jgi:hypothetical protein
MTDKGYVRNRRYSDVEKPSDFDIMSDAAHGYGATRLASENGSMRIEFPNMTRAVLWADEKEVSDRVHFSRESMGRTFSQPVVVVLRPAKHS